MQKEKLKLGIFLDSCEVPAWVYDAIQRIVDGGSGEINLVILNADFGERISAHRSTCVYDVFNRIDEQVLSKQPDPFAVKNVRDLLAPAAFVSVRPVIVDNCYYLKGTDVRSIRAYQLDVLVRFGFERLQCETLTLSKYGIWFYYHGDDQKMKGGPPGFWEVVENSPETGSALLATVGDRLPARVLYRSSFFTYPGSPARHRSYYFWATTPFLQRQIRLLQQFGEDKFLRATEKFNARPPREFKDSTPPSNSSMAISIPRIVAGLAREALHRLLYMDEWFLLFSLRDEKGAGFGSFDRLMPSSDRFWADPHVIRENGRYCVFVEEFCRSKKRGHVAVIEIDEAGNWKAPVKVLEEDYHLSYPFIFNWQGKYYMIPESGEHRTIDAYECIDFPHTWRFKQNLMKGVIAVDTTLVQYGAKWWLFTAMTENEAAAPHVELFLFYAEEPLTGSWTAHPQNPIVSDVKSARPAGGLFVKDGKLFRPSQDCSRIYGYGFDLNEIEILSETEYRERKVGSVRPDWDRKILATHTYANQRDLTVIDAFTRRFKWAKTA
jgi:hypothetical protein